MMRLVNLKLVEGKSLQVSKQVIRLQKIGVIGERNTSTARIELDLLNPRLVAKKSLESLRKTVEELRSLHTYPDTAPDRMDKLALERCEGDRFCIVTLHRHDLLLLGL